MNNNKDRIDDLFREGLDGYRDEPSKDLWQRIESRFFPSPGTRRVILVTGIIIFILGGSALVTWWTIPGKEPTAAYPTSAVSSLANHDHMIATQNNEMTSNFQPSSSQENVSYSQPEDNRIEMASQNAEMSSHMDTESLTGAVTPTINNEADQPVYDLIVGVSNSVTLTKSSIKAFFLQGFQGGVQWGQDYAPVSLNPHPMPVKLPIYKGLRNVYARTHEFSAGGTFMPSVIFYDPNPNNNGWTAGFDLRYSKSRFMASAGAGISQFKDRGSWQVQYDTYDSVGYYTNITSFSINPDNPESIIFETKKETVYDSVPHVVIQEHTNSYTYLDIPAGIGFTFYERKRLSFTFMTGIRFSILMGKNEPTADLNMSDATDVSLTREVPARMKTTWRFTAGLEASYLLTDRLSFTLLPRYEQYLQSVYVAAPGYQAKKPYLIGVEVGIRYRIR